MSTSPDSAPGIGRNRQLGYQVDPNHRPPGWLPVEIAAQCLVARAAFTLLVEKPGRSLRSIGRQLGVSSARLSVLSRAGRWHWHLEQLLEQSPESLAITARLEAQRSRAELLASNRLAEASIDAALVDLIETDEHGNVRLKPGRTVGDVQKLQAARQTHVKTTAMITGQDAAQRAAVAAAGATRIVMKVGSVVGEPVEQVAKGTVMAPISALPAL